MSAAAPSGALVRGEDERARKLRGLLVLLRPYRRRVILTFVALLLATAAALVPPYLAGRAIDDGIRGGDESALTVIVVLFVGRGAGQLGRHLRADLPRQLGRPARAPGPARADLRAPRAAVDRLLLAQQGGRADLADDQRRAGARPARDGRHGHAVLVDAHAGGGGGDPAVRSTRSWRWSRSPRFPVLLVGERGVPDRVGRRVPAHAREDRLDHRVPAGDAVGVRVVRAFGQEARHKERFARAERGEPRGEHEDGLPERGVLPVGRAAVGGGHRGDPALRRQPGARRRRSRSACSPRSCSTCRASSTRSSSCRSSTRPTRRGWRRSTRSSSCSTRSRTWWTSRARSSCRGCGARSASRTCRSLRRTTASCALRDVDLTVPPGQTVALVGATGAGKSTFAKLVARFYDPTSGRVLVDGHDLRDVTERSLRSQLGIVPQEGFLFSGTIARQHRLRPPGRDRRGGRGGGARPWARTSSSRGCRTATTPRWASAAGTSRPGSASSWRSRARRSADPRHPDPRRGDLERGRAHRVADRARAAAAAGGAHGDRDRAPAVDDPRRRPDRGAGPAAAMVEQGTHDELIEAGGALRAAVPRLGGAGGVSGLRSRPPAHDSALSSLGVWLWQLGHGRPDRWPDDCRCHRR